MTLAAIDAIGFLAAALTLATFAQRAMIPMRALAIAANLCFIAYGLLGAYGPVLALHVVLLPINASRLRSLLVDRASTQAVGRSLSTPVVGKPLGP